MTLKSSFYAKLNQQISLFRERVKMLFTELDNANINLNRKTIQKQLNYLSKKYFSDLNIKLAFKEIFREGNIGEYKTKASYYMYKNKGIIEVYWWSILYQNKHVSYDNRDKILSLRPLNFRDIWPLIAHELTHYIADKERVFKDANIQGIGTGDIIFGNQEKVKFQYYEDPREILSYAIEYVEELLLRKKDIVKDVIYYLKSEGIGQHFKQYETYRQFRKSQPTIYNQFLKHAILYALQKQLKKKSNIAEYINTDKQKSFKDLLNFIINSVDNVPI
jgi:hypothetical protein